MLLWNRVLHQPAAEAMEHFRLQLVIVVRRIQHHSLQRGTNQLTSTSPPPLLPQQQWRN